MSQSSILWYPPVTSHKIVSPLPSSPNTRTTTSYAAMQAYRSMLVGFLLLEVRPRMLNWSCGKSSNAFRKYMARRKTTFSATRQRKGLSFPSCAGWPLNSLRRIGYRPKRSSGDAAGGPARYDGPLAPGMRGGPWHARSQQRHGCGQWFWGSTKSRAQPTRNTNNQNITFVIKSLHSRPGGAPCSQTQRKPNNAHAS